MKHRVYVSVHMMCRFCMMAHTEDVCHTRFLL